MKNTSHRMTVLVTHPQQQHSYRLASALKHNGRLQKYMTTVYYRNHSLTKFIVHFLRGDIKIRAQGRICNELEQQDVKQYCEGLGLLTLLSLHKSTHSVYSFMKDLTADCFSLCVAWYAMQHHIDAVVYYDDTSALGLKILRRFAPNIKRVIDISAASRLYMKKIYERDMNIRPDFSQLLEREIGDWMHSKKRMKRLRQEIQLADWYLVPSDFVAESLREFGVKNERMLHCPYGVDIKMFSSKVYDTIDKYCNHPLRCIYVGGVKQIKGIAYLLDAFLEISPSIAELTVVGAYDQNAEYLKKYKDRVKFSGLILHDKVSDILKESDLLVFPSLGEGLSLSVLEAAACGLPLVVSTNSGVSEFVKASSAGVVIDIQSVSQIVNVINWFYNNPDQLINMGKAARRMAEHMSWDNYEKCVSQAFEKIFAKTRISWG